MSPNLRVPSPHRFSRQVLRRIVETSQLFQVAGRLTCGWFSTFGAAFTLFVFGGLLGAGLFGAIWDNVAGAHLSWLIIHDKKTNINLGTLQIQDIAPLLMAFIAYQVVYGRLFLSRERAGNMINNWSAAGRNLYFGNFSYSPRYVGVPFRLMGVLGSLLAIALILRLFGLPPNTSTGY